MENYKSRENADQILIKSHLIFNIIIERYNAIIDLILNDINESDKLIINTDIINEIASIFYPDEFIKLNPIILLCIIYRLYKNINTPKHEFYYADALSEIGELIVDSEVLRIEYGINTNHMLSLSSLSEFLIMHMLYNETPQYYDSTIHHNLEEVGADFIYSYVGCMMMGLFYYMRLKHNMHAEFSILTIEEIVSSDEIVDSIIFMWIMTYNYTYLNIDNNLLENDVERYKHLIDLCLHVLQRTITINSKLSEEFRKRTYRMIIKVLEDVRFLLIRIDEDEYKDQIKDKLLDILSETLSEESLSHQIYSLIDEL